MKSKKSVDNNKNNATLLVVAILLAVLLTFGILNSVQNINSAKFQGPREDGSSGQITLVVQKPQKTIDESLGGVSLTVLPLE